MNWVKRFIHFHELWYFSERGSIEVEAYLTQLASDFDVAASAQRMNLTSRTVTTMETRVC